MASERRLGAGNGQATDDPEADREHAVEDLCVAYAPPQTDANGQTNNGSEPSSSS